VPWILLCSRDSLQQELIVLDMYHDANVDTGNILCIVKTLNKHFREFDIFTDIRIFMISAHLFCHMMN